MDLLLDTCAFIWWDSNEELLSGRARSALLNRQNLIFLSVASIWEMQIKQQKGKLALVQPLSEIISHQIETNGVQLLSIEPWDIFHLQHLSSHHADPFDRLIVSQALRRGLCVVTEDRIFEDYGYRSVGDSKRHDRGTVQRNLVCNRRG